MLILLDKESEFLLTMYGHSTIMLSRVIKIGVIAMRLQIYICLLYTSAKMLREGKTYLEISHSTGASTATISRVNRSLNYGNDGYDMVLERVKDK